MYHVAVHRASLRKPPTYARTVEEAASQIVSPIKEPEQ